MTGEFVAAAADLGASSGRVVLGRIGADRLDAEVVHRFPNEPVRRHGRLVWDTDALFDGVVEGLAKAVATAGGVDSAGVDTWAVDYGLVDGEGGLLGPPVHYRDDRTDGVMERVRGQVGDERLYATTGLQFLPFNTLYQLVAEEPSLLAAAARLLLMPDLIVHHLTGAVGAERTNASTTQYYDVTRREWAVELLAELGLPAGVLPPIHDPGTDRGPLLPAVAARVGDSDARLRVRAVASHDTASAVAAVPAATDRFGYISCGTWSLVGVELPAPVLSAASREANFTNEIGVDGTVRYLRNVMGLWPLQECLRHWADEGSPVSLDELLAAAADEPALSSVFDADAPELLPPGDMPARIRMLCQRAGHRAPEAPPQIARAVLDSLAIGHARTIRDAEHLSGRSVDVVHLVGGGARNRLLAQLTADACELPVVAGPVEATALGNLVVQARAAGVVADQAAARALIAATQPLERYEPRDGIDWPVRVRPTG